MSIVIKVSFTRMAVYGNTLLDSAGAYCPDSCVKPQGRVYASHLFTRQHYTTTDPFIITL